MTLSVFSMFFTSCWLWAEWFLAFWPGYGPSISVFYLLYISFCLCTSFILCICVSVFSYSCTALYSMRPGVLVVTELGSLECDSTCM